jgi:hypothetical protein
MPLSQVAIINDAWPVHAWSGTIQGRRFEGDEWVRLGTSTGSGSQTLFARAPDSPLTVIRVCSTQVETFIATDQAEAWQRETIVIQDDQFRRWRALVKAVQVAVKACKGVSPTSAPAYAKLTVTMTIEALSRV